MKSHCEQIARYMRAGHTITPLEALKHFGCFRLGARIYDLRRRGYKIRTRMLTDRPRVRVAQYSLLKED